jgi:hypothetical protein
MVISVSSQQVISLSRSGLIGVLDLPSAPRASQAIFQRALATPALTAEVLAESVSEACSARRS